MAWLQPDWSTMTTTNPFPVDSATRPCCGAIGGHSHACRQRPTVERHELPPVPAPGPTEFSDSHVYAVVTAGSISAKVRRLCYWDPRDADTEVDVTYEVSINGLPEHGGTCDILAETPDVLTDLAAVCTLAAELLAEVKQPGKVKKMR